VVQRLGLGAAAEESVARLVADSGLLNAASRRPEGLDEERVLQLAVHLGSREQCQALYLLTLAANDMDPWERSRLDDLYQFLDAVLARPELTGKDAANLVDRRRAEAMRLAAAKAVRERIAAIPRAHVLATPPEDLLRQAALCEPPLGRDGVRVAAESLGEGRWRVEIAAQDRVGLLARETRVLHDHGLDVLDAVAVTWDDGAALTSYEIGAADPPSVGAIETALGDLLAQPLTASPVAAVEVRFDNESSPWHTICEVEGEDRPGLLRDVTAAFALAGATVLTARVRTVAGAAQDVFELMDRGGRKLDERSQAAIRRVLERGARPRRTWRRLRAPTANAI
jgi:[protein-PII] uridylyltransferase